MSTPMRTLLEMGHRPRPGGGRQPRVAFYYARRDAFSKPGVVLWLAGRQFRIIPLRRHDEGSPK